jgi:transposase InsO family protein
MKKSEKADHIRAPGPAVRGSPEAAVTRHVRSAQLGTLEPSSRDEASATILADAREKLDAWRRDYNEIRPHSAIGYNVPAAIRNHDGTSSPPSG